VIGHGLITDPLPAGGPVGPSGGKAKGLGPSEQRNARTAQTCSAVLKQPGEEWDHRRQLHGRGAPKWPSDRDARGGPAGPVVHRRKPAPHWCLRPASRPPWGLEDCRLCRRRSWSPVMNGCRSGSPATGTGSTAIMDMVRHKGLSR
jgi:hypothetical protein